MMFLSLPVPSFFAHDRGKSPPGLYKIPIEGNGIKARRDLATRSPLETQTARL
jgi:hypothetical protein